MFKCWIVVYFTQPGLKEDGRNAEWKGAGRAVCWSCFRKGMGIPCKDQIRSVSWVSPYWRNEEDLNHIDDIVVTLNMPYISGSFLPVYSIKKSRIFFGKNFFGIFFSGKIFFGKIIFWNFFFGKQIFTPPKITPK